MMVNPMSVRQDCTYGTPYSPQRWKKQLLNAPQCGRAPSDGTTNSTFYSTTLRRRRVHPGTFLLVLQKYSMQTFSPTAATDSTSRDARFTNMESIGVETPLHHANSGFRNPLNKLINQSNQYIVILQITCGNFVVTVGCTQVDHVPRFGHKDASATWEPIVSLCTCSRDWDELISNGILRSILIVQTQICIPIWFIEQLVRKLCQINVRACFAYQPTAPSCVRNYKISFMHSDMHLVITCR